MPEMFMLQDGAAPAVIMAVKITVPLNTTIMVSSFGLQGTMVPLVMIATIMIMPMR
jgi:hypothetical protein